MRLLRLSVLVLSVSLSAQATSAQTVSDIAGRGACSTAGVEGLSAQLSEAQRCLNPSAFVRFAPHTGITISSDRVHPYAQASARDAIHRAAADVPLTINSAFRTVADQYVLYNSGGCGVAASPGRSNHQSGRAIDVQNWSAARSALEAQGCTWFGSSDAVHFDCPGSDLRDDSVRAFQSLWNVNNPGDTIAVDGAYGPQTNARLSMSPAGGFPMDACDVEPPSSGGRLRGVVYSGGDTEMRVLGATVEIVETGDMMSVNATGEWAFDLDAGEYTVEARADGFAVGRRTCIVADTEVWCSVELREGSGDGTLRGTLFAASDETPLAGDVVTLGTGMRATASADGTWSLTLAAGRYTVVGSAEGYASVTRSCTVVAGVESDCPIGLYLAGEVAMLQGVVYTDEDIYQRVIGATVRVRETSAETVSRGGDGLFLFLVPPGTYTVEIGGPGFVTGTRECVVEAGDTVVWCSVGLDRDGTSGGLMVEVPGEEGTELPPEELERAGVAPLSGGCSAGSTTSQSALWMNGLFFLLFLKRRRVRCGPKT